MGTERKELLGGGSREGWPGCPFMSSQVSGLVFLPDTSSVAHTFSFQAHTTPVPKLHLLIASVSAPTQCQTPVFLEKPGTILAHAYPAPIHPSHLISLLHRSSDICRRRPPHLPCFLRPTSCAPHIIPHTIPHAPLYLEPSLPRINYSHPVELQLPNAHLVIHLYLYNLHPDNKIERPCAWKSHLPN